MDGGGGEGKERAWDGMGREDEMAWGVEGTMGSR